MKANSWFTYLAGAFALAFVIAATECHTNTDFPPFVKEICTDNIDNDGDGLTDCKDSDCALECKTHVTLSPITTPITADSIAISGTQTHAASIAITVTSPGVASQPVISGSTWQANLTRLTDNIIYTVVVVATDSNRLTDTAKASFERK